MGLLRSVFTVICGKKMTILLSPGLVFLAIQVVLVNKDHGMAITRMEITLITIIQELLKEVTAAVGLPPLLLPSLPPARTFNRIIVRRDSRCTANNSGPRTAIIDLIAGRPLVQGVPRAFLPRVPGLECPPKHTLCQLHNMVAIGRKTKVLRVSQAHRRVSLCIRHLIVEISMPPVPKPTTSAGMDNKT